MLYEVITEVLNMGKENYVAYVSTYTMGDNHGIKIYDVDMENGRFLEKNQVQITNSVITSYSIHYTKLYEDYLYWKDALQLVLLDKDSCMIYLSIRSQNLL